MCLCSRAEAEGSGTCRLSTRATGTVRTITALSEADLDTRGSDAAEYTIEAVLHDCRRLSVGVRHVDIRMPCERFNVVLALNDRPYLRLNNVDLDIYLETAIDERIYLLHCFRDRESPFATGN